MACVHLHQRLTMPMTYQVMIGVAFVILIPYTAPAYDDLPKELVLPLSLAGKAIQASLEACKKDGYKVSASVVDRAGVLRAMARADGAGPHTVDSSRKKAYTAASLRRPTTELAELINKMPTLQALREMNDQVLMLEVGYRSRSAVRSSEGLASVGRPAPISMMPVHKQGWMRLAQRRKFQRPSEASTLVGCHGERGNALRCL